jgi:hypothetical protein
VFLEKRIARSLSCKKKNFGARLYMYDTVVEVFCMQPGAGQAANLVSCRTMNQRRVGVEGTSFSSLKSETPNSCCREEEMV